MHIVLDQQRSQRLHILCSEYSFDQIACFRFIKTSRRNVNIGHWICQLNLLKILYFIASIVGFCTLINGIDVSS